MVSAAVAGTTFRPPRCYTTLRDATHVGDYHRTATRRHCHRCGHRRRVAAALQQTPPRVLSLVIRSELDGVEFAAAGSPLEDAFRLAAEELVDW
jgi:hypothetical protein